MHLFPISVFRPQLLVLAPFIAADHSVGSVQDMAGGTVILLQLDHFCPWKSFLKAQDIPDIRPAELVNGLVVVSHYAEILIFSRQQAHQLKLGVIGVLILVHHDIAEPLLVILPHFSAAFQKLHRLHDQIIKIQGIVFLQQLLILLVDLSRLLLPEITACVQRKFFRGDQLVLCGRDLA